MKDDFNKKAIHPLQSWEWGEFREAWGNKAIRLPNFQIIFSKVPFTNFKIGTVIRGPKLTKRDVFEVTNIARKAKAIFVKFEPNVLFKEQLKDDLKSFGLISGRRSFTTFQTIS